MPLLALPTDALREIVIQCSKTEKLNITETCCDLATIVHSIQPFWAHVQLRPSQFVPEGPQYLRRRLRRAGVLPLAVSIGGPMFVGLVGTASRTFIKDICLTLSECGSQISELKISTRTSPLAGFILTSIFPNSHDVFPTLKSLSVRVEEGSSYSRGGSPLGKELQVRAIWQFPMLRSFAIPILYDCIPMFPELTSFSHLHTLILDGSLDLVGEAMDSIPLIVGLLYSVPHLETLWLKHKTWEQMTDVKRSVFYNATNRREIRVPVLLPRLNTLSVAAPGCGSDILHCIEAPALQALHLDGSRGPYRDDSDSETDSDSDSETDSDSEADDSEEWSNWHATSVQDALKCLASRTRGLRRIAITSVYLTHAGWQWLLFGGAQGPPFPQLESLALHGLEKFSGQVVCGFDDALLSRYSNEPAIPLRRLVILGCELPLSGYAVVRALERMAAGTLEKSCQMVFDTCCPQITEDELKVIVMSGVSVVRQSAAELEEVEWWTHGHQIDASDSYAF